MVINKVIIVRRSPFTHSPCANKRTHDFRLFHRCTRMCGCTGPEPLFIPGGNCFHHFHGVAERPKMRHVLKWTLLSSRTTRRTALEGGGWFVE